MVLKPSTSNSFGIAHLSRTLSIRRHRTRPIETIRLFPPRLSGSVRSLLGRSFQMSVLHLFICTTSYRSPTAGATMSKPVRTDKGSAIAMINPADVTASKSSFKVKFQKVAKIFSSSKDSKPSAMTTTTTTGEASKEATEREGLPLYSAIDSRVAECPVALTLRPISELWDEAYDDLAKEDKSLAAKYEAQLRKSLFGNVASSTTTHSQFIGMQRCQQMKILIDKKTGEINEGKWKIKFKDHDFAIVDLVEPIVRVIDWATDFVTTSLVSNPYGSIGWLGVCVLLPVNIRPHTPRLMIHSLIHLLTFLAPPESYKTIRRSRPCPRRYC